MFPLAKSISSIKIPPTLSGKDKGERQMKNKANERTMQRKGIREWIRKFFVSLKRSPQNISLVSLLAAFLVYSLNLTSVANTTARINSANMGQCEFAAMLFSILAFVCFLRAFPKRQNPDTLMLCLLFIMMAVMIFADVVYYRRIIQAVTRAADPIKITVETAYIAIAQNVVLTHIVLIAVTAVLILALPLYIGLLQRINTSIDVEGYGDLEAIDISGED